MEKVKYFSDFVLEYNDWLSSVSFDLFDGYRMNNPFQGIHCEKVKKITYLFYQRYYRDVHKRYLILGSSPARRGTGITGIPFEDAAHLYEKTGIEIDHYFVQKSSADFLYEVIEAYGGCDQFYQKFYMNFVCPLGIVKENENGKEINSNYYENKKLEKKLLSFIVESLKKLISLGIDTSVCYCIGSGENYQFLLKINEEYHFFHQIIALEHPRFIMQYHSKEKEQYLQKYLDVLRGQK